MTRLWFMYYYPRSEAKLDQSFRQEKVMFIFMFAVATTVSLTTHMSRTFIHYRATNFAFASFSLSPRKSIPINYTGILTNLRFSFSPLPNLSKCPQL